MNTIDNSKKARQASGVKWQLALYDGILLALVSLMVNWLHPGGIHAVSAAAAAVQIVLALVCILGSRLVFRSYHQIWRYAGNSCYIQLMLCDAVGGMAYYLLQRMVAVHSFSFIRILSIVCLNLLLAVMMRMVYQYLYDCAIEMDDSNRGICRLINLLTGLNLEKEQKKHRDKQRKINIAVVGAGRVGVMLAEELLNNPNASYVPMCFIDVDQGKVGRYIYGVEVLSEEQATLDRLASMSVQEIVFAIPGASAEKKKSLYELYQATGCRLKTYDFPVTQSVASQTPNSKRQLRSFDPQELLFREVKDFTNQQTRDYYRGKTVLISGGGGSIGSELSRQIAKMSPKKLIILDVYENCAYDIQQELKIAYDGKLDLQVEILSVCDYEQLETIFAKYRPDVVLHAAAHKHVPLMEHNCCEAVKNNVFGTWNMAQLSEQYGVDKFIMISTDKAVNPTNAMGATKRMCEMIVQSMHGHTKFSATRFGNVLGSNGSVIPLFRRQIESGGPVTLTDRRIIRYFMTIPEASQLVLTSGAMARNGELYVLDMGKPVKILDLAENMIRLSGFEPYKDIDIVEIGLRPGEKLYEELLIKTEELDKTDNSMIFVERDQPLSTEEIREKLRILRDAVETEDNDIVRAALKQVVPTYRAPEEVNADAGKATEMNNVRDVQPVL